MTADLYLLLILYFTIGALAIGLINKRKDPAARKNSWIKYLTYFLIVNLLFISITFHFFPVICFIIILFSTYEIIYLAVNKKNYLVGLLSLIVFIPGFYSLSLCTFLEKSELYYLLFIVTVFDAFSQLAGQYLGIRKLVPSISPNKTVEGLAGGLILSIITGILIRKVINLTIQQTLIWSFGMASFAFTGDLFASFIKRKYGVKDFSRMIPGHGGFLDRFDSLIFSTFFVQMMNQLPSP